MNEMSRLIDIAEKVGGEAWPLLVQSTLNNARVVIVSCGGAAVFCGICGVVFTYLSKHRDDMDLLLAVVAFVAFLLFGVAALTALPDLMCPACEAAANLVRGK
jgi:hypothetical protein